MFWIKFMQQIASRLYVTRSQSEDPVNMNLVLSQEALAEPIGSLTTLQFPLLVVVLVLHLIQATTRRPGFNKPIIVLVLVLALVLHFKEIVNIF